MFSLKYETKRSKIIILSILCLFLFTCIFSSLYFGDELLLGSLTEFNNDDVKYLRSAQTLLNTGKLTYNNPDASTVFIMPGIVLLITPFVALFGLEGSIMPIRFFFALLQTGSLYVVYLIARKVFNPKTGIIAMILSFLYLPNIYVSTLVLTEAPFYILFVLMIYMTLTATETKKAKHFIIAGVFWGLAALFRPTIAAFPLIAFIYWLFKKVKIKQMITWGLCALIPFVLLLSPWVIRNAITFDRFIPFTLSSGNPRLQGTVINYSKDNRAELYANVQTDDVKYGTEIENDAAENELAARFFSYNLKTHPGEYAYWYTIGKTAKNFEYPFIWHPLFYNGYIVPFAYHYILLLLFIAYSVTLLLKRKATSEVGLLICSVLIFNCIYLPFYCFPRYMYPIMCFVIIIVSNWLYGIGKNLSTHYPKIRKQNGQERI